MVVRGRSPRHRGVHIGRVLEGSSWKQGLLIASTTKLKLGDGLVVDRGLAEEQELGGPIFDIAEMGTETVRIRFGREVERNGKMETMRHARAWQAVYRWLRPVLMCGERVMRLWTRK
jgi:hypothetical protein